jgi:hypothetical protein
MVGKLGSQHAPPSMPQKSHGKGIGGNRSWQIAKGIARKRKSKEQRRRLAIVDIVFIAGLVLGRNISIQQVESRNKKALFLIN